MGMSEARLGALGPPAAAAAHQITGAAAALSTQQTFGAGGQRNRGPEDILCYKAGAGAGAGRGQLALAPLPAAASGALAAARPQGCPRHSAFLDFFFLAFFAWRAGQSAWRGEPKQGLRGLCRLPSLSGRNPPRHHHPRSHLHSHNTHSQLSRHGTQAQATLLRCTGAPTSDWSEETQEASHTTVRNTAKSIPHGLHAHLGLCRRLCRVPLRIALLLFLFFFGSLVAVRRRRRAVSLRLGRRRLVLLQQGMSRKGVRFVCEEHIG